jgi:hypothetical protein
MILYGVYNPEELRGSIYQNITGCLDEFGKLMIHPL